MRAPRSKRHLRAWPLLLFLAGCTLDTALITPPATQENFPAAAVLRQEGPVLSPVWKVGDEWRWSDGYGLKVVDVAGDITTFHRLENSGAKSADSETQDYWIKRKGFFTIESQSADTHRQVIYRSQPPDALFPLEAGKKVSFQREYLANDQLKVHLTTWKVMGKNTVEVPAGIFECWVLEMTTESQMSDWTGFERWWYSPVARNYVRMEYKYGNAPGSSRVLMSYSAGK